MADKPILFSGPMVLAILDGRKSQTRRVLKAQPTFAHGIAMPVMSGSAGIAIFPDQLGGAGRFFRSPPFIPGDRLWVKETHFAYGHWITTDEVTKTGRLHFGIGHVQTVTQTI